MPPGGATVVSDAMLPTVKQLKTKQDGASCRRSKRNLSLSGRRYLFVVELQKFRSFEVGIGIFVYYELQCRRRY